MALTVLFAPMYPVQRASSRYRLYQYLDGLRQRGMDARLIEPPASGWRNRAVDLSRLLRSAATADVLFVQKRTLWQIIHLIRAVNRNIVYDFDDALYARPQVVGESASQTSSRRVRSGLKTILKLSRHVIAGNDYLADYARRFNDRVTVIPTALNLRRYQARAKQPGGPIVLGWVGDSSNLVYLDQLIPVLDELGRRFQDRLVFKVISNRPFKASAGLRVVNQPWRLETEIEDLWDFDIGLMPLSDNEWTRGKCGFKALQCMALEIPVVVSPVGVNAEIVTDGVNGFLATSTGAWVQKLEALIGDAELRRRVGAAARETVEARFSLQRTLPALEAVLRQVAGEPGPASQRQEE